MKTLLLAAAAATMFAAASPASAAQIVMGASNIVGATPSLASPTWAANNIFDNQTGVIAPEGVADGSFWLANDSAATAFITIDLGAVYTDLSFDFFNTHNAKYYDRGIGGFDIFASNTLAPAGLDGFTLGADAQRLLGGTLAAELDDNFQAQTFASNSNVGYRYLQLRPTSVAARNPFNARAYGLNELLIFGEPAVVSAVPEPGTWAMMILGFGISGTLLRRRAVIVA